MGAWVFGGIAAAGALFLTYSAWRARRIRFANYFFWLFTGPSTAMALYLATGSWRVAIATAVLAEIASWYVRRLPAISGNGSGLRTATPQWAQWLAAVIAVAIAAADWYEALIVIPYFLLARSIYEFFLADTREMRDRMGTLYAISTMLAMAIATGIFVIIAQASYQSLEQEWFISILIFRFLIMFNLFIVIYVPILIWNEIRHT